MDITLDVVEYAVGEAGIVLVLGPDDGEKPRPSLYRREQGAVGFRVLRGRWTERGMRSGLRRGRRGGGAREHGRRGHVETRRRRIWHTRDWSCGEKEDKEIATAENREIPVLDALARALTVMFSSVFNESFYFATTPLGSIIYILDLYFVPY